MHGTVGQCYLGDYNTIIYDFICKIYVCNTFNKPVCVM